MTDNYKPIACGLHSEYELLAMHGGRIRLNYRARSGETLQEEGRVIDVLTRNKAEYLVLERAAQMPLEVRLDRIRSVVPLQG